MPRFSLPLAVSTVLLALAGCGGGTPHPPPAARIAMRGIAFVPARVDVRVGQRVTWVNDDAVAHDVRSTSGERIASPVLAHGATFSFTPTRAGTIAYASTIQPGMDGTIVVRGK